MLTSVKLLISDLTTQSDPGSATKTAMGGNVGRKRLEAADIMTGMKLTGYLVLGLGLIAGAAAAQESNNRVAAHTDWSVFEASEPSQCWSVSAPKEQVNTRDGRVVAVRRDAALLFVSYIPSSNVNGQVSFTGGYPFRDGSTVTLDIGGTAFELFTEGEMAWSASDQDAAKIVTAMKRGAEAVVTGFSTRGTKTEDTFSLFGFTAAVEDAEKRCQ